MTQEKYCPVCLITRYRGYAQKYLLKPKHNEQTTRTHLLLISTHSILPPLAKIATLPPLKIDFGPKVYMKALSTCISKA